MSAEKHMRSLPFLLLFVYAINSINFQLLPNEGDTIKICKYCENGFGQNRMTYESIT